MAFRTYKGLRASGGALTGSVFRQSLPSAALLSRPRRMETSAQVNVTQQISETDQDAQEFGQVQGAQTKEAKDTRSKYRLDKAAGKKRYEIAAGQQLAVNLLNMPMYGLTDIIGSSVTYMKESCLCRQQQQVLQPFSDLAQQLLFQVISRISRNDLPNLLSCMNSKAVPSVGR